MAIWGGAAGLVPPAVFQLLIRALARAQIGE